MDIHSLMMIFPVAFMIHDFEELCFLESWIRNNADEIRNRFTGKICIRLERHSTAALGIGIMMMFLFVSSTSILAVALNLYTLFAAAMIIFMGHNLFHIVQPIFLRRYIPAAGSALLTLPYPFYVLRYMSYLNLFVWREAATVAVLYGVVTFLYLALAQRIGIWVDKQFNHQRERNA